MHTWKVKKRSGRMVEFDTARITNAIDKAFKSVYTAEGLELKRDVAFKAAEAVNKRLSEESGKGPIPVERIQDAIEAELMAVGEHAVTKCFILYRERHKQLRRSGRHMPANAISDYVFASRYARYHEAAGRRETWDEAVDRVRDMHIRKLPQIKDRLEWAFDMVRQKRVLPSMRSMQFAGKAIETKNLRMYNCSFSCCDRLEFFKEAMYLLLCGVGVGFSVEFEHIEKLPALAAKIDEGAVVHHTIADTIEGWGDAVHTLLLSYLSGTLIEFNYSQLRPKGAPLKTSGGRAPGHVPLRKSIERIRDILDGALGRTLKPIECYDIVMHLADAVLAGGIRRSACICLFSLDDGEMMLAKSGEWYKTHPQRRNANNSVKCLRDEITKAQFLRILDKVKQWGEPGFFFAKDVNVGANPCCEIGMYPFLDEEGGKLSGWAFCNLTEINGGMIKTKKDFEKAVVAAAIIGTAQAAYTDFPYLGEVSEKIAKRDALLGVSITGFMDNPAILLHPDAQKAMAKRAIQVNKETAAPIGLNQAARVTCCKPSGTSSLLLGTSSGIHPRHGKRYFRRVTANKQ